MESRPGSRPSQGARPRNMSSESLVRKQDSPIQTKSGSEASVQVAVAPQTLVAMISPGGALEKIVQRDASSTAGERHSNPEPAAQQQEQDAHEDGIDW